MTAEIQGIFSCPPISFAADPLCCTLLIWQQLNLIQLKVHGKQISKLMVASLCESRLSIPEEEEPVPGVTLLSPGLGTVNHEQHHPLSSEQSKIQALNIQDTQHQKSSPVNRARGRFAAVMESSSSKSPWEQ